jgi:hypothetical protein
MRGDVARSGFFSSSKGAQASVIEDTDTLVPSIGQFNLSKNRTLSLHTNSSICIN